MKVSSIYVSAHIRDFSLSSHVCVEVWISWVAEKQKSGPAGLISGADNEALLELMEAKPI